MFIAIIVILGIIISISGDNDDNSVKKVDNTEKVRKEKIKTEFKVGETASYKGYEIKVNSVDFSEGGKFNKPDEGKKFVVVNLTITNHTNKTQTYNPYDYKLNADGNATDMDELMLDVDNRLESGELDKGATVTGNLVGQADPNKTLKLDYHSNMFEDKMIEFLLN